MMVVAYVEPTTDLKELLLTLNRDYPGAMTFLIGLDVLARVLGITGKGFCTAVPQAAGATVFVVMALVFSGLGLGLTVVGQAGDLGELGAELAGVGPLFAVFGYLAFLRFLRRLAEYLGTPRLAERARRVLVGSGSLFLATFLAALAMAQGGGSAVQLVAGLILVFGIPSLFVLYARLVHDLRRVAEAAAAAAPDDD
jgi:hypothetical protein